jgi:stage IV sporulation protein FB
MDFSVLKIKVSLSPLFFAVLTSVLLLDKTGISGFAVLFSFLHEMGHTSAALLLGKRILSVRIVPTGINIILSAPSSYEEELFIAAAGPLMNALYALIAAYMPYTLGATVRGVSLFLALFNLLPLSPLDGGRILTALLSPLFASALLRSFSSFCNLLLLTILWIFSLYIFFYSGINFMLLLFCAYLFSYIVLKKF